MPTPNLAPPAVLAVVLGGTLLVSPLAANAIGCCPSDGHGVRAASATGLGEPSPDAVDLSADPAWQVYAFERDGIRYVQINDHAGVVRAAVGRIDDFFWVLPIGSDADRVATPENPLPVPANTQGRLIYRSDEVEIRRYQGGDAQTWSIAPSTPSR